MRYRLFYSSGVFNFVKTSNKIKKAIIYFGKCLKTGEISQYVIIVEIHIWNLFFSGYPEKYWGNQLYISND